MATKTPIDPRDSLHGEEENLSPYGLNSEDPSKSILERPTFRGDDPGENALNKPVSPGGLKQAEASGGVSNPGTMGQKEAGLADQLGRGFTGGADQVGRNPIANLVGAFGRNRRRTAVGAGAGGAAIGLLLLFFIATGPVEFIHLAKLLQRFHFTSNEDFGDGRTNKVLLYSLIGEGAERGRLGITGNYAADKWENRLVKDTGLRPVYSNDTGRLRGYAIIDPDNDTAKALRAEFEANGGEVRKINGAGGQGVRTTGSVPNLDGNIEFLDQTDDKPRAKRVLTRSIGKATNTYKIASALGSRLLINRGGINFHPLGLARKASDSLADYRAKVRNQNAEEAREGVITKTPGTEEGRQLVQQVEELEQQNANLPEGEVSTLRGALVKGTSAAAVLGVVCSAKSLGDDAAATKQANNVMPMMRMGMKVITTGNQVMSGDEVTLDELGALKESLQDEETGTSWRDAKSIQAEEGRPQTGPDIPQEAQLAKINNKPDTFEALDTVMDFNISYLLGPVAGIAGLLTGKGLTIGTACDAIDTIAGLPVISTVSAALQSALDVPVKAVSGKDTAGWVGELIGVINGKSVNVLAKGAEYGNLTNTGAFLAANDQAVTMGGVGLDSNEVAQLKEEQAKDESYERSQKPLFARYLDPYDDASLAGKVIDNTPDSTAQVASLVNPASLFSGFSRTFASLAPKAQAAEVYDYGVKKYGYSQREQDDPMFEDPYENAVIVEDEANDGKLLNDLNDKYGKCFGMKVTYDDSGVHIESDDASVNVFKLENDPEYKDCRDDRNQEMFKRYRFYLADAQIAISLACYEGDNEACSELGLTPENSGQSADSKKEKPNVVLILGDDHGYQLMDTMDSLNNGAWAKFNNGFIQNPICCPSKSTILSGQFDYNTGVTQNPEAARFNDSQTLATWLKEGGYRTGFFGKYLNEYPFNKGPEYVPSGWDEWSAYGPHGSGRFSTPDAYFDYNLIEKAADGNVTTKAETTYSTDYFAKKTLDFIESSDDKPFFAYFTPFAPHLPATPAERHKNLYSKSSPFIDKIVNKPSVNEADMSDKPGYLRSAGLMSEDNQRDALLREYRSLEAVDEAVDKIIKTLEEKGELDNTLIIYLGDNGYMHAEHRLGAKSCGYEECIKVPYLIRGPGINPGSKDQLVSNVDIAPTIMSYVGLSPSGGHKFDGNSLKPLLEGGGNLDRSGIILHGINAIYNEPWHGVRTEKYTYIKTEKSGFIELYDLKADPFQINNIANRPASRSVVNDMEKLYGELRK